MYNQIISYPEKGPELSGKENEGELHIPTTTVAAARDNKNKTDLSKTPNLRCKNVGHLIKDCRDKTRDEPEQKQNLTQKLKGYTPKKYSPCPYCQKTNQPLQKCWKGPNAADVTQKYKEHASTSDNQ